LGTSNTGAFNTDSINQMMDIFIIIAGVLALWYAIFGKAPGFNTDYPKEIKAEAEKMLRLFCWILGPVAIVTGVLEMLPGLQWVYLVGVCIMLPTIIVYIVLFRKKFGKNLKKMK
jgi:hypothetical protein